MLIMNMRRMGKWRIEVKAQFSLRLINYLIGLMVTNELLSNN